MSKKAGGGGIPFEDIEDTYPPEEYSFFICIGYTHMNEGRAKAYRAVKSKGYNVLTYIHPSALVQTEEIGEGTLIFENVTIGVGTSIGVGNVFYPCSHIAHHTAVGDFNFFAISCSIAGHVRIGNHCFFGNNCSTKNGIIINDRTLVGAGAYLAQNSSEDEVFVPQRAIKLDKKSFELVL